VLGALLTTLLIAAALLSFVWTPGSAYEVDMDAALQASSSRHWLGTDAFGRDVASQILVGARASIAVGLIAVGIGLALGVLLGLVAAARRGWVEEIIMRLADFTFAFPALLSAIMLTAVFGAGMVNAIIAIGIFNIPTFARITRASANAIWARDYVLAARACGKSRRPSRCSMCCPILRPCWSCRPPFSLRWPFWPRPPYPIWAWARSRPSHPGGACSAKPRP
jgi:peptide/nickel transport system permease protein